MKVIPEARRAHCISYLRFNYIHIYCELKNTYRQ